MTKTNILRKLYNEMNNIDTKDFFQLISEAQTEEEREFFIMAADVTLKQKQRKIIITELGIVNKPIC